MFGMLLTNPRVVVGCLLSQVMGIPNHSLWPEMSRILDPTKGLVMLSEYLTAAFLMFGILCFGCLCGRLIIWHFCTPKSNRN